MEIDSLFCCDINHLFEKKFTFDRKSDWTLPSEISKEDSPWQRSSLNSLKHDLNEIKSQLNDKGGDWHEYTTKSNKSAFVIQAIKEKFQPEILTQAWCKFYEIIWNFNVVITDGEYFRSLHLCEAPGAFISALNYFLHTNYPSTEWTWTANSLNPYYEGHSIRNVVVDDRLLFPTLKHWYFGLDNTGDITDPNYIQELCSVTTKAGLFDLITADGSVDCLDNPGEQELVVEKLHFAEVLIALSCLSNQGCFILKRFTFFECSTICQLFLLTCVFEKVHVFKPFTSRPSNSEVYVICLGFQGSESLSNILQQFKDIYSTKNTVAVFPKSSIPESFIEQVEQCMKYFTSLQIKAIKENLMLYSSQNDFIEEKLEDLKKRCAELFIQKYPVYSESLNASKKLYGPRKKVLTSFSDETPRNHKILYFQAVGDTFNNIRKSTSMSWHERLLDVENRINVCFPHDRKRSIETNEWCFAWKEIRKRIKSKSFQNWLTFGKRVTCINNSKFCYPVLLHLWNKISLDDRVLAHSHLKADCCWNNEVLENIFEDNIAPINQDIVILSLTQSKNEKDSFLLLLEEKFGYKVKCCLNIEVDKVLDVPLTNYTVYINTTFWVTSLHNECLIKRNLAEGLFLALKNFKRGDTLLLCIQSLLTRYTVGMIFLIMSLFEKFTTVLPEDCSSANIGQIWIFKNFQAYIWSDNVIQHFKVITELNSTENKDILEIVPLASLCDGPFYTYIRNLNNRHLLQRLKSLIAVEKFKVKKAA